MNRGERRGVEVIDHEVAIRHRVEAVRGRPVEAQLRRDRIAIQIEPGPGKRGAAKRQFVHPDPRIVKAASIAPKHRDIGHQVMAERHRLARLEVGIARHDGPDMLLGAGQQRLLQRVDPVEGNIDRAAHEKFEIGRHLVVARPRGVELASDRPDQFGQPLLDMHVDILKREILDQLAVGIFHRDPVKPGENFSGFCGAQNALRPEHRGMGL